MVISHRLPDQKRTLTSELPTGNKPFFIHALFLPVFQPNFSASVLHNKIFIIAFFLLVLFCYIGRQILDIFPLGDLILNGVMVILIPVP